MYPISLEANSKAVSFRIWSGTCMIRRTMLATITPIQITRSNEGWSWLSGAAGRWSSSWTMSRIACVSLS